MERGARGNDMDGFDLIAGVGDFDPIDDAIKTPCVYCLRRWTRRPRNRLARLFPR
jgi:hypothetical protein